MIISIVQITLISICGFFMLYLAILSILAYKERDIKSLQAQTKKKFVIVVPAYNEADTIARTLQNLLDVDYPADKFDVLVIADNCTDNTAEIAKKEGTKVMIRNNPEKRGKGYALRYCFDKMLQNKKKYPYDAVVVVDADSIVTENLLRVMNKYSEGGGKVIQGYLTVDSKPNVWTSEIIRIGFALYNYVRPLARRALGYPAGLRGNGMCFSMDVLEEIPWDAYSLTEDLEYGLKLLLHDVNVVFAPEAIGYNVVPEDAKNAESQRERWEIGRYPVLKKYFGKLFLTALKRRSFKILDTLIDLVTPPIVNLLVFSAVMSVASLLLWWFGIQQTLLYFWLWCGVIGLGIFHALLGLHAANAGKSAYRSLLYVPKYALWKIYIYFKILFKGRTSEWVRTSRENNS
ncbi:MAG: glycosyltransferase family 2 protein [Gracilimonas sp.]|uniref:glycosyltransferase family 2 protein n=1 Tax=Gracilimonas sp. TaxID=1974203 RepID=UPI0019B11CE4|nr:glycosyltransferase family 2 protein [Gracilimonas sp.]MBD3615438.1 glycosyltransferase family 2 protein [Gracilimonas sp.]